MSPVDGASHALAPTACAARWTGDAGPDSTPSSPRCANKSHRQPRLSRREPKELDRILAAIESTNIGEPRSFTPTHDHFRLLGEDNFRRYRPVEQLRIRVHENDTMFDVFARAAAARAAGCRATVSSPPELAGTAKDAVRLLDELTDSWGAAIEFVTETDEQLARAIVSRQTDRVRYAAARPRAAAIRQAAADSLQYIADTPPVAHGRVELLWYFQEQSLSVDLPPLRQPRACRQRQRSPRPDADTDAA